MIWPWISYSEVQGVYFLTRKVIKMTKKKGEAIKRFQRFKYGKLSKKGTFMQTSFIVSDNLSPVLSQDWFQQPSEYHAVPIPPNKHCHQYPSHTTSSPALVKPILGSYDEERFPIVLKLPIYNDTLYVL